MINQANNSGWGVSCILNANIAYLSYNFDKVVQEHSQKRMVKIGCNLFNNHPYKSAYLVGM